MARRLNLTRNQLASFCKDFEQIRQFELLFSAVNSLLDSANDGANLAPPVVESVTVIESGGDGNLAPPVAESITYIQNVINAPDLLAPEQRENNSVKTDYIDFDRAAPVVSTPGRLWWDEDEKTAVLALSGGNIELHLGQEELQDCYNGTGATLTKGTVVQVTGAQGNRLRITKAQANAEATSVHTFGFVDESIASGAEGFVINSGLIRGLNTINDSEGNALTAGDTLYLSTTVAGGYTRVKPVAPDQLVIVGFAVRISSTVGSIFVKVDNGYEIEELHNVKVTAPVLAGSLLIYDDTLDVWKNARLTEGTGVTITNGDASITINAHVPVTLNASVTDVLSLTTQEIGASTPPSSSLLTESGSTIVQEDGSLLLQESYVSTDKIVFFDRSASKLTYLAPSAPIQITGTILEHATSGVTAQTYGSATQVAQVTVDTFGHVTSASNVTISGTSPGGAAGGDLTGTYPNPTIANNAVTNAKLDDMLANTLKGNNTASPADPIDLTGTEATALLDTFTTSAPFLKGLVPSSTGGTSNFLRADGTWQPADGGAPAAHASTHQHGGSDEVATATAAANAIPKAGAAGQLAAGWMPSFGGDVSTTAGSTVTTINSNSVTLGMIQPIGTDRLLGRDSPSGGNVEQLTVSGGIEFTGVGGIQTSALTGDVTKAAGGTVTTIANNAVTNAKLDDMDANSLKGNNTGASADPKDLTVTEVKTLLNYTPGDIGAQPSDATLTQLASYNTNGLITQTAADTFTGRSVAGTANQISVTNGDGVSGNPTVGLSSTIVAPGTIQLAQNSLLLRDTDNTHNLTVNLGSNLTASRTLTIATGDANRTLTFTGDATISGTTSGSNTGDQTITLTGDVTGSGTGSIAATIANDAVTYAKIQNVAANSVLARAAATSGDVGEVALAASQLLGRGSTGDVAAITLGTNLSMSGTTLNATGGGGSVTIGTSAADVLSVTGSQINGVDPNADRIVFWDDSAGKLTYLSAGTNLSISGTSLNASVNFPNNFGTIAVAGETNVVADVDSDTLTLAASNMVAITTTPSSDTVTINVPLLTGDVTTTSAGAATIANLAVTTAKINDNAVTFTKFQEVTGPAFIGLNTASLGPVTNMSPTTATAMLDTFTSTLKGLAPVSGGGTTNYLRADGTWAAPPGTGVTITIGASANEVLSATGSTINAVDPNAPRIVVWNDLKNELSYATASNALNLAGETLDWIGGTASESIVLRAGITTAEPLRFQSGTNLTTPAAGAVEFNSAFHATPNTTTGRGYLSPNFGYWQNAAGSAIGTVGAAVNYFPANSSINLEANTTYEIEAFAYFLKTSAGTVAWGWLASQPCDLLVSTYIGTAAAGFTTTATTAAPITGSAAIRSASTLTHAATASLTNAVDHAHTLRLRVDTGTSACNLRLRFTVSAGTITPKIGSYYRVIKILTSGSFAA